MRDASNNLPKLQTPGYRCSVESLGEAFSNSKVTAAGNSRVTSSTKPEAFHPCCTLRPWIFRTRKNIGSPVGLRKKLSTKGTVCSLGKNSCFVSGHAFSRAVAIKNMTGFHPWAFAFHTRCRLFPYVVRPCHTGRG